jgi:lipoprotein-anchoring transpeptidase ErfK/SrfK
MARTKASVLAALAAAMLSVAGAGSASAELLDGMRVASIAHDLLVENTTEAPGELVVARIDISEQRMHVYLGEKLMYVFPISSGRGGYGTPTGRYQAEWLSPRHRSRKYNNAPMPWAVFFHGGYAVHGTTEISRLGRPASHGCVRLHPDNARIFFKMVQASGRESTLITVVR